MRWVKRETLRLALFLATTPFWAARMISGSAARSAASAAVLSPAVIASSTVRTKPRMRDRRALLITVRRAILRVAFLADDVLAIGSVSGVAAVTPRKSAGKTSRAYSHGAGGRQCSPVRRARLCGGYNPRERAARHFKPLSWRALDRSRR